MAQRARGGHGGRAVAAAEQHGVDEQRQQLPQRQPLLVARRASGCDLVVGGERARGRARRTAAASRGRSRGGRRRPPGRSAAARPSAPASTLPLQRSPCRRAGGSGGPASSGRRSIRRARSRPRAAAGQRAAVGRERAAAARGGARRRTRASRRRWPRELDRAEPQPAERRARRRRAERRRARRVDVREAAAELLLARRVEPPVVDPLEREEAVAGREHLRHARARRRLAEPAQAGGLGRVLAGRGAGARLDEHPRRRRRARPPGRR